MVGGAAVVAVVLGAVLVAARSTDPASDLGLSGEPRVTLSLGGPLWDLRTQIDRDGAPDVGFLVRDAPVSVVARARERSGVRSVELRVDGRLAARRSFACGGACPPRVQATFVPRLAGRPGPRGLTVAVHARPVSASTQMSFEVNVGRGLPRSVEVEPVARRVRARPRPGTTRRVLRRSVVRLARRGPLRRLRGIDEVRVDAVGPTALLLRFDAPWPAAGLRLPTPTGPARLSSSAIVDLLVETDRARQRILAVEPGPRTSTREWSGSAGLPTTNATASHAVRLVRLSDAGPAFATYDGLLGFGSRHRDWPLSLVFYGAATVTRVKAALRRVGLVRRGESRLLAYRRAGSSSVRFDSDRGLKTRCDAAGTDLHVRVYAPGGADFFVDPEWGRVVIATAHLDRGDGCGGPPRSFGYSELAERRLAALLRRVPRWRVAVGRLAIGNHEPLRRDTRDATHVWQADGRATIIRVPT